MKSLLFLLLLTACASAGNLRVSNVLGSNMVLQRAPLQASIWGWADAGDVVTVSVGTQSPSTTADSTGFWEVTLDAMEAGGPYTIGVSSSAGDKVTLDNVLFGDVWVCGGQSNMQFTVDSAFNASEEVLAANAYTNVRLFTVGTNNISDTPLPELVSFWQGWSVASAQSVGAGNWSYFSAVCWFFGRDLYNTYNVPIGLISSNWGGTYIQAWSSPKALAQCNATTLTSSSTLPVSKYEEKKELKEYNDVNPNQPSVLWNAMIVPFLKGSIRGAIWYQGEANAGQAALYACMEPAMIQDWRANFGSGFDFPFFFVQLAPWIADTSMSIPDTRQAQLAGLSLEGVGFATAADLGDALSPQGNIHPRNKQAVGARLVLAARTVGYGENVVWQGPTFESATTSISGSTAQINVTFTMYGGGSLVFVNNTCPVSEGVPVDQCATWVVGLSDGNWYNAVSTTQSGATAQISLENIVTGATITGIRYAYSSWPVCTLYSEQGLPAIPFEHLI